LRARGLLRGGAAVPRRTLAPRWAWPVAIAAGLLLFVGGFALGRRPAPAPAAGLDQYTLLLYEGAEFNSGRASERALVEEYSAWAGELAGRGRLVGGEKLGADAWTLGGAAGGAITGPTGYFVIAARDHDEALAIARTCPHLRHGGIVSVRPIEPT
ncbi:MAG: YciI family protein, partial [Gemmatimonadales bacterium]